MYISLQTIGHLNKNAKHNQQTSHLLHWICDLNFNGHPILALGHILRPKFTLLPHVHASVHKLEQIVVLPSPFCVNVLVILRANPSQGCQPVDEQKRGRLQNTPGAARRSRLGKE